MAIVRIDFCQPLTGEQRRALAECVNATMHSVLGVPPGENYVVCSEHAPDAILHAPADCPADRLAGIVFIQITLNLGRSPELKQNFYRTLTLAVAACTPFAPPDIFINLVEVARENWSFGLSSD